MSKAEISVSVSRLLGVLRAKSLSVEVIVTISKWVLFVNKFEPLVVIAEIRGSHAL